jgi:hypothetical protein
VATLPQILSARLRAALSAEGLRMRNWSLPGEWVFAIYTADDTYVGQVKLTPEEPRLSIPSQGPCAPSLRERQRLESLCRTFAKETA